MKNHDKQTREEYIIHIKEDYCENKCSIKNQCLKDDCPLYEIGRVMELTSEEIYQRVLLLREQIKNPSPTLFDIAQDLKKWKEIFDIKMVCDMCDEEIDDEGYCNCFTRDEEEEDDE